MSKISPGQIRQPARSGSGAGAQRRGDAFQAFPGKKRWFLRALAIVCLALLSATTFVYLTFGHRPLYSYIAELRSKGEKVTFAELVASLSASTNTSLGPLTNALVRLGEPPAAFTNFGLMHYVGPGQADVAWRRLKPPWAPCDDPATSAWPEANKRLIELAVPLAALRHATERLPVHATPRTNMFSASVTPLREVTVTPFREVTRAASWLTFAALTDLNGGRKADALANAQALARLANLHREEYSMVSAMARVQTAHLGLQVTWEALQAAGWDDADLLSLQRCWETVDLLDGLERGLESERCIGMEFFNKSRQRRDSSFAKFASHTVIGRIYVATVIDNDLLFGLRNLQAKVEMVRSLRANQPLKDILNLLKQVDAKLEGKVVGSPFKFFYLITAITIPNFSRAFVMTTEAETERRLGMTAIALKRYQLRKGRSAPSLEALVPEFIAAVPYDCMSGRPLRYQLHSDGTFALYSVGMDGEDNGGDSTPAGSAGAAGLWEGRDAVWPNAAEQKLAARRSL